MERVTRSPDDICKAFNRITWHDSKLIGLAIQQGSLGPPAESNVVFDVKLQVTPGGTDSLRDSKLVLKSCTILRMNLDLSWKHVVSDDISSAVCRADSDLKKEIERQLANEDKPLQDYLHFAISLIPPAGEIHALARDFELI